MIYHVKSKTLNLNSDSSVFGEMTWEKKYRIKKCWVSKKSRCDIRKKRKIRKFCDKLKNRKPPEKVAKHAKFNFLSKNSSLVALGLKLTELWPFLWSKVDAPKKYAVFWVVDPPYNIVKKSSLGIGLYLTKSWSLLLNKNKIKQL